jgi:HK97 family phage major capsid protein/HK97 family phage prohead protease
MSELKLPRLARDFGGAQIEHRLADTGVYTLSFPASSELPVERWFGTEILSHAKSAVDLTRVSGGTAPLLFNHNWDDPIGMIDAGRLADGRLYIDAHLFATARAKEVQAMIDGGLRSVSIGYEIRSLEENVKTETYTATDWMPLEVSIVTVPADPSVGVGRSEESGDKTVHITRIEESEIRVLPPAIPAITTTTPKGAIMAEIIETPAGQNAGNTDSAAMERLRIKTLTDLGRQHKITDDQVRSWIDEGATPDDAARRVLDVLVARGGNAKNDKPVAPSEIGMSRAEADKFSVLKAARAIINNDWSKAGLELEAHSEIQKRLGGNPLNERSFYVPLEVQARQSMKRDMTTAGVSGSNYLVGTENMSFIDLLRNRSVAVRMGARMMSGMVGNVTIPRQTAAAAAGWLTSESTAITEGQPTIGQLSLSPKHVGAYTEISRLLALQSSPDAESLVMSDLAQSVALAVDLAALAGSGASGQPTGITGTSGVGSVTGTTLAYAGMLEFQTDIGNALAPGCGYVTTAAVAALLSARVKFTSTASPLWDGSLLDANVCGFPGMSSAQMAAASMIFGDWAQLVIAEWGSLAIEVNPYANFQAGIIGVRALYAVDVGVRVPGAFSVATSIT